MEFLPGTISINVGGTAGTCQMPLNIAAGDHIAKSAVVAELSNHNNVRLAGGVVSAYVGGHWVTFDTTTNSAGIACQLFDGQLGNVSVAMVYNGTRQQITQHQLTNSVYAFQNANVTIELQNSGNNLIDTGRAFYYAGGWHTITQDMELLPGSYPFHFNDGFAQANYTVSGGTTNIIH